MTDDPRPRVALKGKVVVLQQLATEFGHALTMSGSEVVVADEASPVTVVQLQAAVDAHVPAAPVDHDAEFRTAVEAAGTLAALKAAILGATGPGAEPRRPGR